LKTGVTRSRIKGPDWQQSESRNSVQDDYRKINIENAFLFDSENLTLPALVDRLQLSVRQTE